MQEVYEGEPLGLTPGQEGEGSRNEQGRESICNAASSETAHLLEERWALDGPSGLSWIEAKGSSLWICDLPNSWCRLPLKGSMTMGEVVCFSTSYPWRRMMAEGHLPMALPTARGIIFLSFWRGIGVPHQRLHHLSTWMCLLPENSRCTISLEVNFRQWNVRWKRSHSALTFQGNRIQVVYVLPVKRCHPSTVEEFGELFSLSLSSCKPSLPVLLCLSLLFGVL